MINKIKKHLLCGFKGLLEYYLNPQAHIFFGYYTIALLAVPVALACSIWYGLMVVVLVPFLASVFWGDDFPEQDYTVYNKLKNKIIAIYKKIF